MRSTVTTRIWLVAALAIGAIGLLTAGPLWTAWRCIQLYEHGERADAELVGRAEAPDLVLRIVSGPRAGEACTASTNPAHYEAAQTGDPFRVILLADRPDTCTLEGTLEISRALFYGTSSLVVVLILLLVLAGLWLQRSFRERPPPNTRFDLGRPGMACPRCEAPMAEGYLVPLSGLHWRDANQPIGFPHALAGLPGTVGWRGRPRLHAYRCDKCAIATFQYERRA
jgi:hypothetical protein